jgi:hypothetical protein
MKITKIMAIVALVLAGVAGYMGYNESQGVSSSLSSAFNGQPSDNVMIKYIVAGALAVVGIILLKK